MATRGPKRKGKKRGPVSERITLPPEEAMRRLLRPVKSKTKPITGSSRA